MALEDVGRSLMVASFMTSDVGTMYYTTLVSKMSSQKIQIQSCYLKLRILFVVEVILARRISSIAKRKYKKMKLRLEPDHI